jgi:hypothetical protein
VLIEDEIVQARAGVPIHWAMVTSARIAIAPDRRAATLTQDRRTLRVEVLSPGDAKFRVGSTKPPTAAENQNEGAAMLVLDVAAPAAPSDLRIAVLLTPKGERWPARPPPELRPLLEWR